MADRMETARLRRSTEGRAASLIAAGLLAGLACAVAAPVSAATTPPDPAAAQPSLPKPLNDALPLSSPVLGGDRAGKGDRNGPGAGYGASRAPDGRRAAASQHAAGHRRRVASRHRHRGPAIDPLERPALAGVELVAPLPVPPQPPHFTVPVPAYLPENFVSFYTTPLPPVVCRPVARDPDAPDPHLIRETTVQCLPDNP